MTGTTPHRPAMRGPEISPPPPRRPSLQSPTNHQESNFECCTHQIGHEHASSPILPISPNYNILPVHELLQVHFRKKPLIQSRERVPHHALVVTNDSHRPDWSEMLRRRGVFRTHNPTVPHSREWQSELHS